MPMSHLGRDHGIMMNVLGVGGAVWEASGGGWRRWKILEPFWEVPIPGP